MSAHKKPLSKTQRDHSSVARGAGMAFVGRLGALVELAALPIFAWLYGSVMLGAFVTLLNALRILTSMGELAMTTTLQRFIPAARNEPDRVAILKLALTVAGGGSLFIAVGIFLMAPPLANLMETGDLTAAQIEPIIRIYVWTLPLWTMVEVLTSSVRARRRFGPEIRVRIFYEQMLRLVIGVVMYYVGFEVFGLFFAHLVSIALAVILAFKLSARFYNMKLFWSARTKPGIAREMIVFSVLMTPASMIKRSISDLPVLLLYAMIPGNSGAVAAVVYTAGRRGASVLQVVRQGFEYVVAPFASLKFSADQKKSLDEIYAFATRLSFPLLLPAAGFVILARDEVLLLFPPEFITASSVILILALGRVLEAATGPSTAIIEMIGWKPLPLLNGLFGLIVLVTLQFLLVPQYGTDGAAVAATLGLNTISLLALAENFFLYGRQPYRKSILRPLSVSILVTTSLGIIVGALSGANEILDVAMAGAGCFLAFVAVVRYGLQPSDVQVLGKFGRIFGGKRSL